MTDMRANTDETHREDTHPFVFIGIPGAGAETVAAELSRLIGDLSSTEHIRARALIGPQHDDISAYPSARAMRIAMGEDVWRTHFVFAFVQDPVARAAAVHDYLRRARDEPHHDLAAALTLSEFFESDPVQSGRVAIARPQSDWLKDDSGAIANVDFIGRLDRFETDVSHALTKIRGKRTAYEGRDALAEAPTITTDGLAAIEAVYADDFRLLGYAAKPMRQAA